MSTAAKLKAAHVKSDAHAAAQREAERAAAEQATSTRAGSRADKVQITTWLKRTNQENLRELAYKQRRTKEQLIQEALNLLFDKYKMTSVNED